MIPGQAIVAASGQVDHRGLGYRELDELRDAWLDIVLRPASKKVLEKRNRPLTHVRWTWYRCDHRDAQRWCGPAHVDLMLDLCYSQ